MYNLCLSLQLPDGYSAPWKLVFSTRLHGESFTRMVTGLTKHGPTLLLIKDTKGHVFGGFASHTWEVKPQFQGERRDWLCLLPQHFHFAWLTDLGLNLQFDQYFGKCRSYKAVENTYIYFDDHTNANGVWHSLSCSPCWHDKMSVCFRAEKNLAQIFEMSSTFL